MQINPTEDQWEKTSPLSLSANVAFWAVKWGMIRSASEYARNVNQDEIERMDWIGYLAGIPVEYAPDEVWAKREEDVTELVNEWLMGGTS